MISVQCPHWFCISLAPVPVGHTNLSHGALPTEGWVTQPSTTWEGTMSTERVPWGHTYPQNGKRGTCSHPQGLLKVMCWGDYRKSQATGGRSRFVMCHSMTVGDRSHTSLSGESGQTCASHLLGTWLLHAPPHLPGTSLESLPASGTSPSAIPWLLAIGSRHLGCHRCLSQGWVPPPCLPEGSSLLHSFLGSPISDMPCRVITQAQPSPSHQ